MNPRALNRRALRSLHDAEIDVLMAAQRAARRQAVRAVDAALSARHGAAIALVVARFADRRASAGSMGQAGRDIILRQIAAEEAQELARLTLEHAAERRALRSSALLGLITAQRAERRMMRRRNRWQRVVAAVVLWAPLKLHRRDGNEPNDKPVSMAVGRWLVSNRTRPLH